MLADRCRFDAVSLRCGYGVRLIFTARRLSAHASAQSLRRCTTIDGAAQSRAAAAAAALAEFGAISKELRIRLPLPPPKFDDALFNFIRCVKDAGFITGRMSDL